MLSYLRKIRKSLIASGSATKPASTTGRYILYAIGEIALVVIGILIALQINNWNEWRKDRILEKEALESIAENLEFNINLFEKYKNGVHKYAESSDYILSVLNGERKYTDTVDQLMNSAIYRRNNLEYSAVAYETLKNKDLNLITNDSLKNDIIELFEWRLPRMEGSFEWGGNESQPEYMDHHFLPKLNDSKLLWKPYDFNVQINDNYFKTLITKIKIQRIFYTEMVENPLYNSKEILQRIKQELEE
jgi:hypothetical protein